MDLVLPIVGIFFCIGFIIIAIINFARSGERSKYRKALIEYIGHHGITIDEMTSDKELKLKEDYKTSFLRYQRTDNLSVIGICFIFIINVLGTTKVDMWILIIFTILMSILLFVYLTKLDVYKKHPFLEIESTEQNKKAKSILTKLTVIEIIVNMIIIITLIIVFINATH